MVGGRRGLAAVLAGLYLLLLAAPVVLLIREGRVQEEVRLYLADESRWTLHRADIEYGNLVNLLYRATLGEPDAGRDAVQTGIDLLYSRRKVLSTGEPAATFSRLESYDATLAAMDAAITAADAVLKMESGPRVSAADLDAIRTAVARVRSPLQELVRALLSESALRRDELRRRADQQILWLRMVTGALIAASLVYVGVLVWNVVRLRRSAEQLRRLAAAVQQSEGRLRLIADSVPMLIGYVAADRRIEFVNRTGERWSAQTAPAIIGKGMAELLGSTSCDPVAAPFEQALSGTPGQFEGPLTFPDGAERIVEAAFIPDLDGDGGVRGCFVVVIDVTARKESEEQLRQALKMEAVGRLTGGIAHDFNNLLGVIVGNLDLAGLKLGDRPAEQALIERAIGAAERGASLTQRLLAFSRKQTLLPRLTDVSLLIADMSELLGRTLGETIEVVTIAAPEPSLARIDPNQFEAAILNLVVNARDAMPDGGRLTIETKVVRFGAADAGRALEVVPGEYVVTVVSDSGTGMPAEVMARAFEPFFTTKAVGKGSGLGLSMVYGFVAQSGGHVEIDSVAGAGTSVRIYLPRAVVAAAVEPAAKPAAVPSGDGRLVLVVEDNGMMLAFSASALKLLGYRSVEAEDAAAALAVLESTPEVSILFTDVVLPGGMNGVALAETARQRRPGLKVLFTSGFAAGESDAGASLPPETEVLAKPFRIAELGRHLDRVVAAG